jgi:hypothetical protein
LALFYVALDAAIVTLAGGTAALWICLWWIGEVPWL